MRALGGAVALAGLAWPLAGPASLLPGVAAVALAPLGLDFFVTGPTGACPLCHRLGWSTARARHGRGAGAAR